VATANENESLLFKVELRSDPEMLSVVRSAVRQLATVVGLSERECRWVTLAVDEALANIIRHAYQNRRGQPIEVSCRRLGSRAPGGREGRLEFLLADRGRSADPSELRGRPLDEVRPGGLGMHFIREIMDEVEYKRSEGRNQLRLVKYLTGKSPAEVPEGE